MKIHLYLVPYDSAHRDARMGAGPRYLLAHGLEDLLRGLGHALQVRVIETSGDFLTEIATSFGLYSQLAARIAADCTGDDLALVLAGNCGAALGAIAGLTSRGGQPPAVAWFDAHGDFNTPTTTQSGYLDGMCLATAAGLGWQTLAATLPGFQPLQAGAILHAGGRAFDPGEREAMQAHSVALADASLIQSSGMARALADFNRRADRGSLYLHLDADVLDPLETPANHFPAPGGLFPEQIQQGIGLLRGVYALRAMTVASFDPLFDQGGKTSAALLALIQAALG